MAVKLWGSKLPKQKGLSSLTRIPLDTAKVDIFSEPTKYMQQINFVNTVYGFSQTAAEIHNSNLVNIVDQIQKRIDRLLTSQRDSHDN